MNSETQEQTPNIHPGLSKSELQTVVWQMMEQGLTPQEITDQLTAKGIKRLVVRNLLEAEAAGAKGGTGRPKIAGIILGIGGVISLLFIPVGGLLIFGALGLAMLAAARESYTQRAWSSAIGICWATAVGSFFGFMFSSIVIFAPAFLCSIGALIALRGTRNEFRHGR